MKKTFIGIDLSKDKFDYCIISFEDGEVLDKGFYENSASGIKAFFEYLEKKELFDSWFCLEHTGHYGYLLINELSENKRVFSMINPLELKHSIGLTRGKTDEIDAYRIAMYGVVHYRKLKKEEVPSKSLQRLKVLMGLRAGYVKILVQLKNTLKALEITNQTMDLKQEIREHKTIIKKQEKSIAKVELAMDQVLLNDKALKENYDKITKVIGVGNLTAITFLVETGNFVQYTDPRKFACHSGVAPFRHSSGSSVRGKTRTSKLRNKAVKGILFKAASSAIQHDPQLKNYYQKKVNEGKERLSVLNAVANKLIARIFAVQKRNEPFVKFSI